MLYIQVKILCQQGLYFGGFENLLRDLIQFHNTAVFIGGALLAGSKQKPCVILRTHGVRLLNTRLRYCEPMHKYTRRNSRPLDAVMTAIRRYLLTACLFLSIGAATTYAQETEEGLFPEAEGVHMTADSVNASLLSPKTYALGKKEYDWAKGAYASGGYSERIEKRLAKAAEYFRQAIDNSETAAITLGQAIEGREVAVAADASRLAPTDWANRTAWRVPSTLACVAVSSFSSEMS